MSDATFFRAHWLRALAPLLAALLLLASCGDGDNEDAAATEDVPAEDSVKVPDTVRIGTFFSAVDYAPFYVARAEGLFDEAAGGADIEYIEFDSAPAVTESLATGRVDFVFMAEPPALIAASAGIDVKIASLGVSLIQDIVVPVGSDIASASDLDGARVGVLAGTSSHYGLLTIAEDAGVDPSTIELLDLAPPDARAAFEAGELDAWAVWPPFVQQQLVQETGTLLPQGDASIQSIVATRGSFADDYPDVYAAVVDAIAEAKNFIGANENAAQEITAEAVRVDLEIVELSWPRHDFMAVLDQSVVDDIQAKADFLRDAGFLDNAVDVAELVDLDE